MSDQDLSSSKKASNVEAWADAAECLRTLAHPHRLRMIQMLFQGEYTVGELAAACNIPSHMASEHLRLMRDRGLLDSQRQGRKNFYFVVEQGLRGIIACLEDKYNISPSLD